MLVCSSTGLLSRVGLHLSATCPGFLSAMIYWEYNPNDPDWIGPVPLDTYVAGAPYQRVKGKYDADGAVL